MQASIIVPVWNGADVLAGCLDSLREQASPELLEVVCVDNASEDRSAALISERYPHVRLLCQPVNLGFAGGVNAGIAASRGDVIIVLNQDCLVQPGWLAALGRALARHPELGVAGCTISRADGSLDHVGATIRRPEAHSVHLTDSAGQELQMADFVTGAAMAIPRRVVEAVGTFDEGFYPGYYEDADYCYRARRRGFTIACITEARVVHLAQGTAWQADTVKHHANHCLARYRFVAKHFDSQETSEFFPAELHALEEEDYFDRAVGRAIASRDLLRQLPDVLHRRQLDLEETPLRAHRRQLQIGFAQVSRAAYASASRLTHVGLVPPAPPAREVPDNHLQATGSRPPDFDWAALHEEEVAYEKELAELDQQEVELLRRIYPLGFSPGGAGARLQQVTYRLRSLWYALTGLDELLQGELQSVRLARRERSRQRDRRARAELVQAYEAHSAWCHYHQEKLERRLKLLETLIDYDHH